MSNLWDNWPVLPWQSWQGVSVRAREESIVDLFAQVDEGTQVAVVTIVVGAPVYGFNPTTTVVKPRHISDFPHKCNLCGQAAVHLFNSIACSSYSCKNFPY